MVGNIYFCGQSFIRILQEAVCAVEEEKKAAVFSFGVADSEHYGVLGLTMHFKNEYLRSTANNMLDFPRNGG